MFRTYLSFPRNVYLLFLLQVIGGSAATIGPLMGGFIGARIAPDPTLTTLPATSMIIGIAVGTIPAALIMRRIGRRNGFLLSTILAFFASLMAAFAITQNNFYLLCLSIFFIGTNGAFVQQYRFAATESVDKNLSSKALGFVMFAGILSGILGPEMAKRTKDLFSLAEYTGAFLFLSLLFSMAIVLLLAFKNTSIQEEEHHVAERPLKSIITQPRFLIAVLSAATSFAIMTFIMTAIPIHLHTMSHFSLDSTVFVLQSHVVAMFLPSLFTGALIQKLGIFNVLLAGLASFALAAIFGISAHALLPYWVASVLLGIGWNFLYISSTMLLAQSHSHMERFKVQGVNDFSVVIMQMIASFLAGSVLFTQGWINLNLLSLPLIFIVGIIFFVYRKRLHQPA